MLRPSNGSAFANPGRRSFLLGAAAAGCGFRPARAATQSGEALVQPPEIRSKNGILRTTLTAAPGQLRIGDFAAPGLFYNGAYEGPLLRARLGDTLAITLRNDLPDQPTNLHCHGMSVSPQGAGDNVFVHVHPGQQFQYEIAIPAAGRQGPGLFWYHPHAHGYVDKQILGGLSGALVIDGSDKLYPMLKGLPERFFLIKDPYEQNDVQILNVNGQTNPTAQIRPGEMQFWRIANVGAETFVKLRVEGMPLYVVATDGHPLKRPCRMEQLFLGPGQRVDAIAIGPPPGAYAMRTIPFQNQAWDAPDPSQQLATIVSAGMGRSARGLEAEILAQRLVGPAWIDEVRAAPIARRRRIEYSRNADRSAFFIDHHVMDEARVDQIVKLGDTEEWTIVNTDAQYHSFHIHQTPFLVTEVNGVGQDEDGLRDTFSTPPATDKGPGLLKVVIPFTDPVIVGRFVYHCHAADHEDKGMMGIVEVVA